MPRFYDLAAWRKLRKLKLSMSPLCEQCKREGRTRPAKDVDHIIPISKGGEPLAIENLQSLCVPCHSRKTARDKGETSKPTKGATHGGLPTDPSHPWYRGA